MTESLFLSLARTLKHTHALPHPHKIPLPLSHTLPHPHTLSHSLILDVTELNTSLSEILAGGFNFF